MIYNCDDFEQVVKVAQKIDQTLTEREKTLNQEDLLIFSQLKKEIFSRSEGKQNFIPKQILNKYTKARLLDYEFQRNDSIQTNEILIESIESLEEDSSATQSLSFISDEQQLCFSEQQLTWQQILNHYGTLFQGFANCIIIKTDIFLDYFFNSNKYVQQNQSNNNIVYLGLLVQTKEWIVVKEQELQNQSIIDAVKQFVIHNAIYQLYPTMFLKLWLPVYIKIDNERLKFISFSEQGLIDLYQYSQQRLIPDLELHLIFQQVFQQIYLLHKHNIAHRDIKPQNIIYVENKGWVLCDFEHSLKYININGVYDIKGTYAFLLPLQQFNSKIQGVQVKQNLLQNDLYAFAITLVVIKYQIKSQEQIQRYLQFPQDPIITVLLKSVSLEDLQNYKYSYEMKFIRPLLKQKVQEQQIQSYQNQENIEFLMILRKLAQSKLICDESKRELLNQLDQILKRNNSWFNYFHIFCYYEIPQYVNQLKNIIKYKQLRSRKYWKHVLSQLQVMNNQQEIINSLKFMYNIGLTDLFLYSALQYIKFQYDFSIHLMAIDILNLFNNYDEVQNQFNILLKHRDFQQMNQSEQKLFIGYAVKDRYVQLTQQEIDYFKQLGIKYKYISSREFLLNHYHDDRFLEQIYSYIQKILKEGDIPYPQRIFTVQELVNDAIVVKNIQTSLIILEELKHVLLKYQCPTLDWQGLIKMIIHCNQLLGQNNNKKLIKNMNYVMMFNSESDLQQDLLKFQKHQIQVYCYSYKKLFKYKIIHKIYLQIKNLSKCFCKFYLSNTMLDLLLILKDAFYQKLLFQYFFILVYVSKQKELQSLLQFVDQAELQKLIILCFKYTKNQKRVQKVQAKDQQYIICNQRNLVKQNQFEIMSYQFHVNQYIYR